MEENLCIEYKSLIKFTGDLSNLLQHNVVTVSGRLLEKGLVTKDVHDSMLTTEGVSKGDKAARLVSCVLDRIKDSSRCFQDFIAVLREDSYFEDIVLKILAFHTLLQSSPASPASKDPASSSLPPSSVCTVCEPSNSVSMVIERLDKQYIEIEQLVFKTIKHRKVPLEDILDWIRFPPVTLRTQFADFVKTRVKLLANVSSVDELFFILSSYWNSFHPDLLGYLVDKLGDEHLKTRMKCYVDDLHHFRIQTTLGDFLDKWVGEIPPGYKEFVLELREEWRERTVEDFEQFRIRLSRLQSFGGSHMSFMKTAKSSSIMVVLALPAQLFPLNLRQKDVHKFLRDENIVRVMVDGQCVFDLDKLVDYESELLRLCANKHSDIKKISHLLNQPAVDPNIFDEEGASLLWWACYLSRTNLVVLLLDNGANVDLPTDDEYGESPLMTASIHGHVAVCKLLIERRASIEYQSKQGATALYVASQQGHKDVVELLLDRGASVDKPNTEHGSTALMVASQFCRAEVAGMLIARGADVDHQDKETSTPLSMASEKGHEDVCQLLIQHGAEVNHQMIKTGVSPLHFASAYGHPSIVELLIKSGAQLDIQTKSGRTALAWASYRGNKQIVHILLNVGANPDIQDQGSMTALMLATQRGHKDIVKALVERKANPNITADKTSGWNALHLASKEGLVEISRMLIEGGADMDIKDKNGLTAHDIASTNSHPAVCQLLEQYGYKHPPTARYDPVTSLQTFRDILDHGSKLSDTPPKHQPTHNAPGEYYDDTL